MTKSFSITNDICRRDSITSFKDSYPESGFVVTQENDALLPGGTEKSSKFGTK